MKMGSVPWETLRYLWSHEKGATEYDVNLEKPVVAVGESEKKALDFAVGRFGKFDYSQLASITHAYPEWDRYEYLLKDGASDKFHEDPELFFEDPNPTSSNFRYITIHFKGADPFAQPRDEVEAQKEKYLESKFIVTEKTKESWPDHMRELSNRAFADQEAISQKQVPEILKKAAEGISHTSH
jgi:hypothetical protein